MTMQQRQIYKSLKRKRFYNYLKRNRIDKKQLKRYYIKQKISGFIIVLLATVSIFIAEGDMTYLIAMFPLGIYLLYTHDMVMIFKEV